jgi:hypothetical protein
VVNRVRRQTPERRDGDDVVRGGRNGPEVHSGWSGPTPPRYRQLQLRLTSKETRCFTPTLQLIAMATKPQFLSGDQSAIEEFLSRFDVSPQPTRLLAR